MRVERNPGVGPRSQVTETPHNPLRGPSSVTPPITEESMTSSRKNCRDGKVSGNQVDGTWPGKAAWHKNVMRSKVSNKSHRLLWTVVREVKINTRGNREPLSVF